MYQNSPTLYPYMKFAVKDDFLEISNLFKKNRKLFPHIRMGYLLKSIQQNECIFTDGVVIIFKIHQRTVRIGNITKSQKSDCHLNQIVSTTRDGSASKILNQFFNYIRASLKTLIQLKRLENLLYYGTVYYM